MALHRQLTPELLDVLPPDDPRAMCSRQDLRRVNGWMGHARRIAEMLRQAFPGRPPRTLVELGAGDGTLLLRVARLLAPEWRGVGATLVDRQRLLSADTAAHFARLGWRVEAVASDVFAWLERPGAERSDVLVANLFLHHFQGDDLARLLRGVARQSSFFAACEPERDGIALGGASLLWFIGCNDVSRHDAKVSVHAGFHGRELSALWPGGPQWQLNEQKAGWFSHCFLARSLSAQEQPPVPAKPAEACLGVQ